MQTNTKSLGPAGRTWYAGYLTLPGSLHIWVRAFGKLYECDFKVVRNGPP